MWRKSAQFNRAAGVLVLLAGFYRSKERLVVCSFRVSAREKWNTGGWTWGSQRTWALELVQEANPEFPNLEELHHLSPKSDSIKMGTDKIAAQAAKRLNRSHYITSYVETKRAPFFLRKQQSWGSCVHKCNKWMHKCNKWTHKCSKWMYKYNKWMHKCTCGARQMELLKIQSHTGGVQWKNKVKIWGNHLGYSKAEDILWSQKWEAGELLKARSYALKPGQFGRLTKYPKCTCYVLGVLRMVQLLIKNKVNLKCIIAELVWKIMKNCWEISRMVC